MELTAEMVKDAARCAGCGDVGVANIERFAGAPRQMHPKNIFPDCRSVISIVQPIPRGVYRGITEGTHWPNYTFYGYNRLNTLKVIINTAVRNTTTVSTTNCRTSVMSTAQRPPTMV